MNVVKEPVFRVVFTQDDKTYEVYAREVDEEALMGFVCIGDLQFGENTSVVVDPSEEKLRNEFMGVKRFYLPMHLVLRIDEMEERGIPKIRDTVRKDNIRHLPGINQ